MIYFKSCVLMEVKTNNNREKTMFPETIPSLGFLSIFISSWALQMLIVAFKY